MSNPAQLSLDTEILEPGLYRCHSPWKNEMGWTWRAGSLVIVRAHPAPTHCDTSHPRDEGTGLVFQLEAEKVRRYYTRIGPWPMPKGHY
jgi:hypothetical protein